MRFAVIALLFASLLARCNQDPDPASARPLPVVAESARTRIVLNHTAAEVMKRAYRQGPIDAPTVTYLPCKARRGEPLAIVETVIDESGRVVHASVVAGEHGPAIDAAVHTCLTQARLSPARMKGRPVAVFYNMAVSGRS